MGAPSEWWEGQALVPDVSPRWEPGYVTWGVMGQPAATWLEQKQAGDGDTRPPAATTCTHMHAALGRPQ